MTALNVSGPGSTLRLQLQFRGFPFGVSSGSTLAFGGWCGRRDSKGRSVGAFAGFCARRTRGQARAAQRRAAIFRCDTVAGEVGRMLAGGCWRDLPEDRKSVGWGKRVSVRVDLGGGRFLQKKRKNK